MDQTVRRIYVEKKEGVNVEAKGLLSEFQNNLGIKGLTNVRLLNRYDAQYMTKEEFDQAKNIVFSEPNVDRIFEETVPLNRKDSYFLVESLPGQYDQRADSAAQCVQLLTQKERPLIRAAKLIILEGEVSPEELEKIKKYSINPVECREASLEKPNTLEMELTVPETVATLEGFIDMTDDEISAMQKADGYAMSAEDLMFCRDYFKNQAKRNPTITEIKVIDTYWSDHCRHTTFLTEIDNVEIENGVGMKELKEAFNTYQFIRDDLYREKPRAMCLMDIATVAMKEIKRRHKLNDLDESDEINACSIVVDVDIDGKTEPWLVMFKNETHNHPTEIEPFGGAATCLGGAIRDPLSGRSYVYQAMRVTGAADPTVPISETIPGKLPQRKITQTAAAGYSSYGNQIGLATGQVAEVYHPGFVAKRMEVGGVIAAAPKKNVVRMAPEASDVIILLGGRTGRDGCGGATGSSKEHTEESLTTCGSEVQKGNPPTERKIQRLFRNEAVSTLIKKCNDFGAGGVCVAIGELAEALDIELDKVPKKYEGLDGTELAISESQERMAVVVRAADAEKFIAYAEEENLEAVVVATVTDTGRLRMTWKGNTIVDLERSFLDTNGVKQHISIKVNAPDSSKNLSKLHTIPQNDGTAKDLWLKSLQQLNVCSQKGLVERFDSSIGAGTVLMPFGGKYQLTPQEGMAAKIPVLKGETNTGTLMTFGYDPDISSWSPFHGAVYAVVQSLSKIVAMGGDYRKVRLTFQEYFEKPGKDPSRWGKPFAALLGGFHVQEVLNIPAIGGKDSMSGTFKDLDVPPTLVSFAVAPYDVRNTVSAEFKKAGSKVLYFRLRRNTEEMPDFEQLERIYNKVRKMAAKGQILAATSLKSGGVAEAISKMCFGNKIGFRFYDNLSMQSLLKANYGSLILEVTDDYDYQDSLDFYPLGETIAEPAVKINGETIAIEDMLSAWSGTLENVFPTQAKGTPSDALKPADYTGGIVVTRKTPAIAKPRVFIPVFPGTNCEYDTARAFERAGAKATVQIINNMSSKGIEDSIAQMVKNIEQAQMIMIPGGFSGGDEPEGSGKFIATTFRNPAVKEAVMKLLQQRDGLMLGICNGFQALIKLGLVPYGEIRDIDETCPTLTFNTIGRHVSCMVNTRVASNKSPWLANVNVGDMHSIAVSHGEGRFIASPEMLEQLIANGQVATQYVDLQGNPTYDIAFNPNGSVNAIEGITSPDGRILGKMGHSERKGSHVVLNVPGEKDQKLFEAGVAYFK